MSKTSKLFIFCPHCKGGLEVWEAVYQCKSCNRRFFILCTNSRKIPLPSQQGSKMKTVDDKNTTRWFNDNKELHREDGPSVIYFDGSKFWWFNGKLHREDGPAVEYFNGTKHWYVNGLCHREDGPASVNYYSRGTIKDERWFLEGKLLSRDQFKKKMLEKKKE